MTLTNDVLGQAVRRDEADGNTNVYTGGDPHEVWYRFDGRQVGFTGNNGTLNLDEMDSVASRKVVNDPRSTGAFRGGSLADFDQNYDALNSYNQGSQAGSYTVRAGDTLSGIAAQLWGDGNLWYKLAGANGLSGDGSLVAGQTLTLPAGVVRTANNASTFRPYDVNDAYGDTAPTTPKPTPKKNQCGAFGAILLAVVAVAVTALLRVPITHFITGLLSPIASHAAAVGIATVAGGTLAGAAGSIASQGVGVATGIQDKFDWTGVALAGIGAGVGAGLGSISGLGGGSGVLGTAQDIARGALGNAITQGIGVATGLQSKFDWAGVAAAGIGAGIGSAVAGRTGALGRFGSSLAANTAGGLANAAARSVINGTDFGDNVLAALPDIIGQTVGCLVAERVGGRGYDHTNPVAVVQGAIAAAPVLGLSGSVPLMGLLAAAAGDDDAIDRKGLVGQVPTDPSDAQRIHDAFAESIKRTNPNEAEALIQADEARKQAFVDAYNAKEAVASSAAADQAADLFAAGGENTGLSIADFGRLFKPLNDNLLAPTYNFYFGESSFYHNNIAVPFDEYITQPAANLSLALEGSGIPIAELIGAPFSWLRAPEAGVGAAERSFLSVDEFAALPRTGTIEPNLIRFSQDSAGASFKAPFGSVDDFATGLANKSIDPLSVAPVRIAEKDGMIFTLDNRRLYAFQQAGKEIPYTKLDAIPKRELFKFTTQNNGESILIRRGK